MELNASKLAKMTPMDSSISASDAITDNSIRVSEVKNINSTQDVATNSQENISKEKLEKAMDKLNKFFEDDHLKVEYSSHEVFKNTIMIKIIDEDSHRTLLEVPPKSILDMVAKMCEATGIIMDKKA